MKSFLSLLVALVLLALLAVAGYYLYQKISSRENAGSAGYHIMSATSNTASLALTNGTHFVLTVTMKQGADQVRFEIAPGHTETRSFAAGTYNVDGRISDPNTDPFSTHWAFQGGGRYNATFSRDQRTGQVVLALILAGQGQSQGQNQRNPKPQPRPHP
jgi:opacity protein-like surface antigen